MENKILFPLLGIILLVIGTTVGVVLVRQQQTINPKAAVDSGPVNMTLSPVGVADMNAGDTQDVQVVIGLDDPNYNAVVSLIGARIVIDHASSPAPINVLSIARNQELEANENFKYNRYDITNTATQTIVEITGAFGTQEGYRLPASLVLATISLSADASGDSSYAFDRTLSVVAAKNPGDHAGQEDLLGVTGSGTFSVLAQLPACSSINTDPTACQTSALTDGVVCDQGGTTWYCCQSGFVPNDAGTACVEQLAACSSLDTINPNACSTANLGGGSIACEAADGTDQFCCPSGQELDSAGTSCVDIPPTCDSVNTDPSACSQSQVTGATYCDASGTRQYCCPTGQQINLDTNACEDIPTTGGLSLKYRLDGVTTTTSRSDIAIELVGQTPSNNMFFAGPGFDLTNYVSKTGIDTPISLPSIESDTQGAFTTSLIGVNPDTYTVCVKSGSHLRRCVDGVVVAIGANAKDISTSSKTILLAGDINNDNRISIEDSDLINAAYSDFVVPASVNPTADLNADTYITLTDLALGTLNFSDFSKAGD